MKYNPINKNLLDQRYFYVKTAVMNSRVDICQQCGSFRPDTWECGINKEQVVDYAMQKMSYCPAGFWSSNYD